MLDNRAHNCTPGDEEMVDDEAPAIGKQELLYCERFVELLTDLLSQVSDADHHLHLGGLLPDRDDVFGPGPN